MITTTPCDQGHHSDCPGYGLVRGDLRPPHEPKATPNRVWVTVTCECACHAGPAGEEEREPTG
jgi:hypothetical protein